jgi:hypothetical protein
MTATATPNAIPYSKGKTRNLGCFIHNMAVRVITARKPTVPITRNIRLLVKS